MTTVESKASPPTGSPRVSNGGSSRLPTVMQSVRFRLTLLYSLMLFGVASIMMAGIYWGLSSSLTNQIVAAEIANESNGPTFDIEQERYDIQEELELLVDARTLETLRRYSISGLGAIFFASFGVGWFTAGRVLMPIGRITRVARDIQGDRSESAHRATWPQ